MQSNTQQRGRGPLPKDMATRTEALDKLFAAWEPARQMEFVPLDQCVGRTLAQTQYSRYTLPLAHVSACDGIAVSSAAFADGMPDTAAWRLGEEYVMADTGDDFPDRYDAVIRIEDVERLEGGGVKLSCTEPVRPGQSVRPRGSTIHEGDRLMEAGLVIRPTDLSALAMGGALLVPVWKKPVAAFLPTGSELIPWDAVPRRGQNIDSNSLTVTAMLREMGADARALPICRDDPERLRTALHQALETADIVIINGGSSKGGEDYSTRLIRAEGELLQYQVAAVPGRPMALGLIGGKPVINLPGPPLAAYFGADWCLRAIMDRWLCRPAAVRHTISGVLSAPVGPGGPVEILRRVHAEWTDSGVTLTPIDGPTPDVMASNAQYIVPRFSPRHEAGETLEVELLR